MVDIETALRSIALADGAVVAIIGQGGGRIRFYPLKRSEAGATIPAIPATTYQRISSVGQRVHGDQHQQRTDRFQFTHWASSFADARQLAGAFIDAFDGYKGTVGGVIILDCKQENDIDQEDGATNIYRSIQDYMVSYR